MCEQTFNAVSLLGHTPMKITSQAQRTRRDFELGCVTGPKQLRAQVAFSPRILSAEVPAKVLVTGASGYIASHVVKQLQEAGHQVRGTVRSVKNTDKVKHLYNLCPNAAHKLELVEADLMNAESWSPAVEGMTYVIHVASPFPLAQPKNEDELIKPAVEGTLNVLRACAKVPSIKRVVVTSSCAAMIFATHTRAPLSEKDWTDPTKVDAYTKSKTLAECAAWDFVEKLTGDEKFELAVINPSLVLGPPLHGTSCTSVDIMKQLLERQMPVVARLSFAIVDVRDVALAHVRAMTSPEAAGHRHVCTTSSMWFQQVCRSSQVCVRASR
ncbi:hypothetical protein BaRGS_00037101 [Batillaria attramentaria]|uniref:NAD-dependent epimerase/dehydratase domain-containing protein n=1 Tax=Batillaria attramentaria TaxID=370345 RepID=A0ABD0J9U1_9CAEN